MAGKKLDDPYKVYSGFKGTQPGLTNRQMLSIMKTLQKIKPVKKRFGGKVVQKMQGGGSPLSPEEMEKAIREIKEQGTVFGKGKELSKDQTKKIADKFESDFNSIFGKKYGGAIKKMRYGGKVEEYGGGGKVKGGKMSCRGMGAALRGGGYTIS